MNYYYIVAGLPDLRADDRNVDLSLDALREELEEQMSGKDLVLVRLFLDLVQSRESYDVTTRAILATGNQFAAKYINFDATLRNIFIALQGRKYEMDVASSIVGEDDIAEQIRRNRQSDFGLRGEVDFIDQVLQIFNTPDIVEREMKIDALRWSFIDDESFFNYFGVERIVAIILKLAMIHRWSALDEERGKAIFADMVRQFKLKD